MFNLLRFASVPVKKETTLGSVDERKESNIGVYVTPIPVLIPFTGSIFYYKNPQYVSRCPVFRLPLVSRESRFSKKF